MRSVSGQFIVSALQQDSPLLRRPDLASDTNYVRLEPALLAVSAERFKLTLWNLLGLRPGSTRSGKIFLTLYPAQTTNDDVNIEIIALPGGWDYRVHMPDVVTRTRFARAMTAALLLEIANRANGNANHSAELPAWLTDGLARQILGGDAAKIILSAPSKKTDDVLLSFADPTEKADGLYLSRLDNNQRGVDPLAAARRTLQDYSALTYDELCWPTGEQMNGKDGGAYQASAQLFVASLLGLEGGAGKLRALLNQLPNCMNWQTAFYAAYQPQFKRALDVEKWWTLRVIRFAARDPGPHWTAAMSRERLADLLAVPIEYRSATNALPEHTVVSLQNAIRNFKAAQLTPILEMKRRDFELAQFRMAQPFAGLADGYRTVLVDFLGGGQKSKQLVMNGKAALPAHRGVGVSVAVKRLDALDARRREIEARQDATSVPKTLNSQAP